MQSPDIQRLKPLRNARRDTLIIALRDGNLPSIGVREGYRAVVMLVLIELYLLDIYDVGAMAAHK